MPVALSPSHTADEFANHWNIEDKVEVFVDRVQGWQLGVAQEMLQKRISSCEVAVLHIVTSYFEMIAKYREGFLGEGNSREYFKKGLRHVFPDVAPEAEAFMDSLYSSLRCGLYHIGRPGANVIIQEGTPGSIGYNAENDLIMISPGQLVSDLLIHFSAFSKALRDPTNAALRRDFEARFDADNVYRPGSGTRAA